VLPRPPTWIKGPTSNGKGEGRAGKGKGRGEKRDGREGTERGGGAYRREGDETPPLYALLIHISGYAPVIVQQNKELWRL